MLLRLVLCLGVTLILVGTAVAGVPQLINYQGVLLDDVGDPVTTPATVIFAIWNAETDGDSLWSEEQTVTPNASGSFTTLLGSVSPIPDSAFSGSPYLGITVEADPEMSPRCRLVSVGYAYRVGSIDGAAGGRLTGDIIVVSPGNDSTFIGGDQIVIRGAGGDEETEYGSSGITIYQSAATFKGDGSMALSPRISFTPEGMIIFGETDTDTTMRLLPEGDVIASGRLSVGPNHASSGAWSNVAGYDNEASGDSSVVCGGFENVASGHAAAVVGGSNNTAGGSYAAVGGGYGNNASHNFATIPGGQTNTASGWSSTVGGGIANFAGGTGATIGGGSNNTANGESATVPGGESNTASGGFSFAAGRHAKALHHGAFVWGDNYTMDFVSTAANQFRARASGGVWFYTSTGLNTGVTVPAGGGAWSAVSNRELKRNIRPIDGAEVLKKLAQLEVSRWSYKTQDEGIEHIGPMAQDFYRLFGVGDDNKTISTIDPDGISLAAIKELYQQNQDLKKQVEELEVLLQKLLKDEE